MSSISISYTLKYQIRFATNYKFTKCEMCFNDKSGRKIKQIYNSGSIGYNIQGKFYSLKKLRASLEKIQKINLPF